MPQRKLTSENIAHAMQLRRQGYSLDACSKAVGCAKRTLARWMLKTYGTTVPARRALTSPPVSDTPQYYGRRIITVEQLEWAYQRRLEGYPLQQIADTLHMDSNTVKRALLKRYGTSKPQREETQ